MESSNTLVDEKKRQLSIQYITDEKGDKVAVILPIEEFEELLLDLEDLKDISNRKNEETIDHDDLLEELKNDGLL